MSETVEEFKRAIKASPGDEWALYRLRLELVRRGRGEEAGPWREGDRVLIGPWREEDRVFLGPRNVWYSHPCPVEAVLGRSVSVPSETLGAFDVVDPVIVPTPLVYTEKRTITLLVPAVPKEGAKA